MAGHPLGTIGRDFGLTAAACYPSGKQNHGATDLAHDFVTSCIITSAGICLFLLAAIRLSELGLPKALLCRCDFKRMQRLGIPFVIINS